MKDLRRKDKQELVKWRQVRVGRVYSRWKDVMSEGTRLLGMIGTERSVSPARRMGGSS